MMYLSFDFAVRAQTCASATSLTSTVWNYKSTNAGRSLLVINHLIISILAELELVKAGPTIKEGKIVVSSNGL